MNKNILKQSEIILKITADKQLKLLRQIHKFVLHDSANFYNSQTKNFHILKEKKSTLSKEILMHCALIISLNNLFNNLTIVEKELLKDKRNCKKSEKRDKIMTYFSMIQEMRNKNISFIKISKELKKLIKLDVSYVYLFKIYKELTQK